MSICTRVMQLAFYGLFFLTPLLVSPWTNELFEFPKMLFVYALTLVIAAAFLIKWIWSGTPLRKIFPKTSLDLPIILYSSFFILATIFSIHRYTSIFGYYTRFHGGLLSLVSYLVLYYVFITEFSGRTKILLNTVYLLLAAGFLVSVYGILQHFGIDKSFWVQDSQVRIFSTLGQPNWLAAWLLMILPLSWALYLNSNRLILNTGYLLLSLTLFAAFWFTYSLSGLAGFLVAVLVFAGLARRMAAERWRQVLILVAGCLVIVIAQPGPLARRGRQFLQDLTALPRVLAVETASAAEVTPTTLGGDTVAIRKLVWGGALQLWRSSSKILFLGTGPETFAYAFLPFRPAGLNQTSEWDFLYNKAHNEYIDILCGLGLLGFAAYLFLVGKFLGWATIKIKDKREKIKDLPSGHSTLNTSYLILVALISGWTSLLVTNFFGFSVVCTALLFWLYPAVCLSIFKKERTDHRQV